MDVVFRADASLRIGSGHVMRCLTLADTLRAAGARVAFVCREHAGHLGGLIAARGHAVRLLAPPAAPAAPADTAPYGEWLGASWQDDAAGTAAALPWRPDWLVVDHYAIDARWEALLRPAAARIMAIDDLADRPHDCDLLLDQNLAAHMERRYDGLLPPAAVALAGPHYALLRPEFAAARAGLRARDGRVRRLFLFIGGADAEDYTGQALEAALQCAGVEIDVVVGGLYPHAEMLARRCAALPGVRLHRGVDNMAELMAAADLAIGAGGGAMWERACVGLPGIVIAVAANQRGGCAAMARRGHALYLGEGAAALAVLPAALRLALAAPDLLAHMEEGSLALVDGRGAERVARRMRQLGNAASLRLRPATAADCDPVWHWRNAEQVRRFSASSAVIALEPHRAWFAAALADPSRQLLIGEIDGRPAGVLRYDRVEAKATVSVYLTPDFIGQGIGAALIAAGSDWVRQHWPQVATIEAVVLPGNRASTRAFESAGYAGQLNILALRIRD